MKALILNAMTRLAVEADPGKGALLAVGYEEAPGDADTAERATLPLVWAAGLESCERSEPDHPLCRPTQNGNSR